MAASDTLSSDNPSTDDPSSYYRQLQSSSYNAANIWHRDLTAGHRRSLQHTKKVDLGNGKVISDA